MAAAKVRRSHRLIYDNRYYSAFTSIPFSAKYFAAPAWKGTVMPLVAFSRLSSAPFAFSAVVESMLSKIAAVSL